ncbi:MAG TPA: malto-oligosyltrehalose trehalohydrolase [Pirellulales bacterium]|jgi:maltooligosyltrehalose trehalohydrolase|nr:malto-oligosyltrehalose trehalohydrolase [Pirellulales bacterium]
MQKTIPQLHERRLPVGAECLPEGGVHFRIWAPKPRRVYLSLALDSARPNEMEHFRMKTEGTGYYFLHREDAKPGMLYGFRIDNQPKIFNDPASRFQPQGTTGLSQIVDPQSFAWSDHTWKGLGPRGQVIYEMHVGSFTAKGTFEAAAEELAELARIGITVIEVMPVAEFSGRFGWGYDGVLMFAPTHLYGTPDDLRRFVDAAHAAGLGVILDVVYNHFGNVDNYLGVFADNFKSAAYQNEWADAINFDGHNSTAVREFFTANARYWIEEFHLDGFRFDATQQIFDNSDEYILAAVGRAAKEGAGNRTLYLVAENEPEDVAALKPPEEHGWGLDGMWNDDFHHAAHVQLTGANPAYYSDFSGTVEELAASVKRGLIYQGQHSRWQNKRRGTPTTGLPAWAFVSFLENHDQVANSPTGQRLHQLTSPNRYRAMIALWLLMPQTPLFFQGQEFAASSPFLFFADFSGQMAAAVVAGRAKFMSQFPSLSSQEAQRKLPNPTDPATFHRCKLNFADRETNRPLYDLHIDLLKLRREDSVFCRQQADALDTAILSTDCFLIRYFGGDGDDRVIIINFGQKLNYFPIAEPLLAPPADRRWQLLWNSNAPRYGGAGAVTQETEAGWSIEGESTTVFQAVGTNRAGLEGATNAEFSK